jgi:hypothetical protein
MSDDFGTINVRRGERTREIEVMRQHYHEHRDALQRMQADAPTEHLASEYERLIAEIDRALGKLAELESAATLPGTPPPPGARAKTEAGTRPLIMPAASEHDLPPAADESRSRLPLIVAAGLVVLAVIGWLIWRASSDRDGTQLVVEERAPLTDTAPVTETVPVAVSDGLVASPPSHDYGTIRKGTRATRQFEIANNSEEPVSIVVARSACRCLYYEHAPVIPPKAKENLTVTVDGARAKAGELRETLKITAKADPSVGTMVDVIATVR